MRSVALIGFSLYTLPFLKNSKADEFWSMNHVFLFADINRVDRLFEIHKRDWYLRGEMDKSAKYDLWLRDKHPFPIYMQEAELNPELIPSGIRYPLEEVCEKLIPNIVKSDGIQETKLKYFTSSASFMIALAIYEEYDQIELYGIDCDSDTEYGYQKPAVEFWLGVAVGRGIKVILPEPSTLCTAPIYGYDIVPYIDKNNIKEIIDAYQVKQKELKEEMDEAAKLVYKDPGNEEYADKYLKASSWVYLYDGAIRAGATMMQNSDSYISRQMLEIHRSEFLNGMEYWKAIVNSVKGKIELSGREELDPETWKEYLNARASMFGCLGATELHTRLMKTIDFRKVNWELTMDITED